MDLSSMEVSNSREKRLRRRASRQQTETVVALPTTTAPPPLATSEEEDPSAEDVTLGVSLALTPTTAQPRPTSEEEVPSEQEDEFGFGDDMGADAKSLTAVASTPGRDAPRTLYDLSSAAASGSAYDSFDSPSMIMRSADYRLQRWELKRLRTRARAPLPDSLSSPTSGFTSADKKKRLPPGIRRMRTATWVTTVEGKTAVYHRLGKEFADYDYDEDGNPKSLDERLVYPHHDSFESDVDSDEYDISYISCPSDMSFTAHPTDYEAFDHVSLPDDLRHRTSTHTDDIQDAWSRQNNFSTQRDAIIGMAMRMDNVLDHIDQLYHNNRKVMERVTESRDALSHQNTLMHEAIHQISRLSHNVAETLENAVTTTGVDILIADALQQHLDIIDARIESVLSQAPASKPGHSMSQESGTKNTLATLERGMKKRLTDHAARLADGLARRRTSHPTATAWSPASASQMDTNQHSPRDTDSIHAPFSLRGGGLEEGTPPPESPSPPVASSTPARAQTPPTGSMPPNTTRLPTPWSNGNAYSERMNRITVPHGGCDYVQHSAPEEVHQHYSDQDRFASAPPWASRGNTPCDIGDATSTLETLALSPLARLWHGGGSTVSCMRGALALDSDTIISLGVPSSLSYMISSLHSKIVSTSDTRGHDQHGYRGYHTSPKQSGPSHNDAVKYTGWPDLSASLDHITPELWIDFYTSLQLTALHFGFGLMPFDALSLQYADGGHALCLCGLGYEYFSRTGATLFLILQKIIPSTDPHIRSKVQSVALNGGNGFALLWILTKHFVPMITTMRQLQWPTWPPSDDIFLFARRVNIYCTLSRLRGQKPFTDSERSTLFLQNTDGPYRDYAQHLLTTLSFHLTANPDGMIPPHLKLSINDLVEKLVDRHRDEQSSSSIHTPLVRLAAIPRHDNGGTSSQLTDFHLQGFCVNVARVGKSTPRAPPVPSATSARRGVATTRRTAYDGTCDACGKYGHQASTCDMLGMGIWLKKYCSDKSNQSTIQMNEEYWVQKNKKWIPTDTTPRKVLSRYCNVANLSLDQVDAELDWDLLYCDPTTASTASDDTEDVSQPQCTRALLSGDDAPTWFNTHSTLSSSSSAWYPQSFKVGINPKIPPGSLFDSDTMPLNLNDFRGEEVVVFDAVQHPTQDPTLSASPLPVSTMGLPTQVAMAFKTFHNLPAPDLDLRRCLLLSDPVQQPAHITSISCLRIDGFQLLPLADSGSNVYITNDLSILSDVVDIAPQALDVAVSTDGPVDPSTMCTKYGYVSIRLLNGSIMRQRFLFNASASETIISPEAMCSSTSPLATWVQCGGRGGAPGCLIFFGTDETTVLLSFTLAKRNGLYYGSLPGDADRWDSTHADHPAINTTSLPFSHPVANRLSRPVSDVEHLTSELWAARLGHCGTQQLAMLPNHAVGIPSKFFCHPLRFIDIKEDAAIKRKPSGRAHPLPPANATAFSMDFGFMRSSSSTYGVSTRNTTEDRVVESYDGYVSYLLILCQGSRRTWGFTRKSKEPPTELVDIFLSKHGLPTGGSIRCDQGGELARSDAFRAMALKHLYTIEPTGADSPSQNGAIERWNGTLAVTVRALLYGAGLPPKYWSSALLHAVYIHNRRVHAVTKMTPFESWHGTKPDLTHLRVFGSRVCVKKSGKRDAKLDLHAFHGIFIGYTATDHNIRYIDLDSGMVKTCHHAVFDEAWYTQAKRPPTAQLLYDLGLRTSTNQDASSSQMDSEILPNASSSPLDVALVPACSKINGDAKVVHEFDITHRDLRQVYFSPSPFNAAFEETHEKRYLTTAALTTYPTGGLILRVVDKRCILESITTGSPFARIPRWRSRLKGAWLIRVDDIDVFSQDEVASALKATSQKPGSVCSLLFSHPEIKHGLTNDGIPQISIDQLNPGHRLGIDLPLDMVPPTVHSAQWRTLEAIDSSLSYVSNATRLTRGKLMKQIDWDEWRAAERLQWDQYETQGMLGTPCPLPRYAQSFNIVWQYAEKHDGRKKARATCDGSSRGNVVRVHDHTYASTPDHIGQRIFFSVCSAENFVVFGSDAANAFAEANPPRQGINLKIDPSFRDWWEYKGRPPLPEGYVIPLQSAMQGHPEAPRLWERHIDGILRRIGFIPTTHEPCLYSGVFDGKRVLLLRQVDDFAVGAIDGPTCEHVFDCIDHHLKIPLKRLGPVTMYNGVNIDQTRHYIKISCESYINKICDKHLSSWMRLFDIPSMNPTPLPTTSGFMKTFLAAEGIADNQLDLEQRMRISYRSGVGELIYAMVTCRPDISPAVVRCSQACVHPHEIHYHAVKHILKYLYLTKSDGLYFWRTSPNNNFPDVPPPQLSSTQHDLLMDGRPEHSPMSLHGYVDSDWATCPKTRRSMTGVCIRLAGGTIAWKTKLQPTVAQSSTEAEFMGASDFGKMMLYIRSILWDIGIPQEAASFLYEDNDACTAMAMAQKPTPRTRHMDIKFYALCEWVERDLLRLERIDTTINLADHFTKSLTPILFRRHVDYIMGRVPPRYSQSHPTFRFTQSTGTTSARDGMLTPAAQRVVLTWTTIVDSVTH